MFSRVFDKGRYRGRVFAVPNIIDQPNRRFRQHLVRFGISVAIYSCAICLASNPVGADDRPAAELPTRTDLPTLCTYEAATWDVERRRAHAGARVTKPYSEVTAEERDPDEPRCTLCEQDQVEVDPAEAGIVGLAPVKICWVFADRMRLALKQIQKSGGFEFLSVRGYRPGRTRGPIVDGKRTLFSNHSYGTAIDINAAHNGLYVRCDVEVSTGADLDGCKLRHGGPWDPAIRVATTIVPDGPVVRAMSEHLGWQWGGSLSGNLKDFMHFSITGR